jgi:hypothetical protein
LHDLEEDDALEDANLNSRKEQQVKLQYKSYKKKILEHPIVLGTF